MNQNKKSITLIEYGKESIELSSDSNFYKFIHSITSQTCSNIKKYIDENQLFDHLNRFLFVPYESHEFSLSLEDRISYNYEFSRQISIGNADMELSCVHLQSNMCPIWTFILKLELPNYEQLHISISFTIDKLIECEILSFTNENFEDINFDLNSNKWRLDLANSLLQSITTR